MYSQPSFYRFSEDSIKLTEYIKQLEIKSTRLKIADLCAGSGVVGIETSLKLGNVSEILFVELQKEFIPYLNQNCDLLDSSVKTHFEYCSLGELKTDSYKGQFDLVLANPPYFDPSSGRKSPNLNKQLCRSFERDSFETLFSVMKEIVSPDGRALFLGRESHPHIKMAIEKKRISNVMSLGETSLYRLL